MISKEFIVAIKLNKEPAYRLAQKAGVDHTVLSAFMRGIRKVRHGDKRIVAVGALLGLTADQCFEEVEHVGSNN